MSARVSGISGVSGCQRNQPVPSPTDGVVAMGSSATQILRSTRHPSKRGRDSGGQRLPSAAVVAGCRDNGRRKPLLAAVVCTSSGLLPPMWAAVVTTGTDNGRPISRPPWPWPVPSSSPHCQFREGRIPALPSQPVRPRDRDPHPRRTATPTGGTHQHHRISRPGGRGSAS